MRIKNYIKVKLYYSSCFPSVHKICYFIIEENQIDLTQCVLDKSLFAVVHLPCYLQGAYRQLDYLSQCFSKNLSLLVCNSVSVFLLFYHLCFFLSLYSLIASLFIKPDVMFTLFSILRTSSLSLGSQREQVTTQFSIRVNMNMCSYINRNSLFRTTNTEMEGLRANLIFNLHPQPSASVNFISKCI